MVQKRYSDILTDILQKKHSKCTCPPAYFAQKPKREPNANTEGCQFGPDCQFMGTCNGNSSVAVTCQYNLAKCTCADRCICGPQSQPPVQLLKGPQLDQVINTQTCICRGDCFCEVEDPLIGPTYNCDKTKCICNVCLCQPTVSDLRLLPSVFRNAVKKEPIKLSTEDRIKQECAEIKQILIEHEESKKKEVEESPSPNEKPNRKQVALIPTKISISEDHSVQTSQNEIKEDITDPIVPQEEGERIKSPQLSVKNVTYTHQSSVRPDKSNKKEKQKMPPKQKQKPIQSPAVQLKPTTPSEFTQYSCGCRMPKKKPLHTRYYFAGGTENYGVRLGHKQCLPKPALVPKNMGWLWNIEDPSKGIRERKGWPPGFICKNIQNMIKVLKQFEDTTEPSPKVTSRPASARRFGFQRRNEGEVGTEPQEEPPLLHIHKKGRTYNITFCPKSSDTDIGPIPIPFSITEKRKDSDSSSSDSTLEFEFHSPKPKRRQQHTEPGLLEQAPAPEEEAALKETTAPSTSTPKASKKKPNKKRSLKSTEENKNLWEEQQTQIENIP